VRDLRDRDLGIGLRLLGPLFLAPCLRHAGAGEKHRVELRLSRGRDGVTSKAPNSTPSKLVRSVVGLCLAAN